MKKDYVSVSLVGKTKSRIHHGSAWIFASMFAKYIALHPDDRALVEHAVDLAIRFKCDSPIQVSKALQDICDHLIGD